MKPGYSNQTIDTPININMYVRTYVRISKYSSKPIN